MNQEIQQYQSDDAQITLDVRVENGTRLYTFGASFKDLGKKLFCFSLMESEAVVEAVRGMVESSEDFAE